MAPRSTALGASFLVLGILGGCRTIETKRPVIPAENPVRTAAPKRLFEVLLGGEPAGSVVLFEGKGQDGSLYVVRNSWNQDLGLIDALGRAYRYLPHRDPAWLGSGTIADGVRRILDAGHLPELSEVHLQPGVAIARK